MKNLLRNRLLWITFLSVLAIKILASFIMQRSLIFSDEACTIQIAKFFAHNFALKSCPEITLITQDAGGTFPLYPLLLSPIYFFFDGMIAYRLILILNAIISASLVFPLHWIFKNFIADNKKTLLYAITIVFLVQFSLYEKFVMTELLFAAINIWLLYFYMEFQKHRKICYIATTVVLGILAALTRPYGFITPLAIAINETVLKKRGKIKLFIIYAAIIALIYSLLSKFTPGIFETMFARIKTINDFEHIKFLLIAIKNQINSFSITTLLIPIIIFAVNIRKPQSELLDKIKFLRSRSLP